MSADNPNPAKANSTKRETERTKTCLWCRMYFDINMTQGKKKFCSARCKMAYHRFYDATGKYKPVKPSVVLPTPEEEIKVREDIGAMIREAYSGLVED